MSLIEYARALRKRWVSIVLLVVLGGIGGFLVAHATPHEYKSTGSVLVTSSYSESTAELSQGSAFVMSSMPSYVVLATSDTVLRHAIDELGISMTPAQLRGDVSAATPLDTSVIQVSGVQGSAAEAHAVTAAVMHGLVTTLSKVSPHGPKGQPSVAASIIQEATLPGGSFLPNTRLSVVLGAMIGLLVAVAYALLRRAIGDPIKGPRDIAEITDAPVLGQVLESRREMALSRLLVHDPLSPEAESVRTLGANLNFLRVDGGLRSVVITSPRPDEGKSTVALGLAVIAAESGKRVLLIDGDLRRPSIARKTQLEAAVGLTDVLLGDVTLEDAIQPWSKGNVTVLVAGSMPPNPSHLISSGAMRELIDRCENEFDLVVIDSGPVLSVSDTLVLSHICGGALLVARRGRTTRRAFAQALIALQNADPKLIGTALTRVPPRGGARRYHYRPEVKPRRETFRPRERRAKEPRLNERGAGSPDPKGQNAQSAIDDPALSPR